MQIKVDSIIKTVSAKNTLNEEALKSISDKVFKTLHARINNPTKIIIYLPGIGKFYARKEKTKVALERFKIAIEANPEKYANLKPKTEAMAWMLEEYKRYDNYKSIFKENANNYKNPDYIPREFTEI